MAENGKMGVLNLVGKGNGLRQKNCYLCRDSRLVQTGMSDGSSVHQ